MSNAAASHIDKGDQDPTLLEVRNLKTYFYTENGVVKAVDGVDLSVRKGEIIGLVGESGCGKTVTSLSIMRLISAPGLIVDGEVILDGKDLLRVSESEMTRVRGNRISMIFQQPQSALTPVRSVSDQICEVLDVHQDLRNVTAWNRMLELLKMVGIPEPERYARSFPHELSGGMAQRVMIAIALACRPDILLADEPTTALDVTIQAQILDLMQNLCTKTDAAIILITHDLGVIAEMVSHVAVMYAGYIVEQADVKSLFAKPLHPYTQGLINSIPILGRTKERLEVIPGSVPTLISLPPGCRFAPRCTARIKHGLEVCTEKEPALVSMSPNHSVRCWLYNDSSQHTAPLTPFTNASESFRPREG